MLVADERAAQLKSELGYLRRLGGAYGRVGEQPAGLARRGACTPVVRVVREHGGGAVWLRRTSRAERRVGARRFGRRVVARWRWRSIERTIAGSGGIGVGASGGASRRRLFNGGFDVEEKPAGGAVEA